MLNYNLSLRLNTPSAKITGAKGRGVKEGRSPSYKPIPPHAKNTSPYYGEGDTGGEVGIVK